MRKSDAVEHFGGAAKLASALGLKSRQAIYGDVRLGEDASATTQAKFAASSTLPVPL